MKHPRWLSIGLLGWLGRRPPQPARRSRPRPAPKRSCNPNRFHFDFRWFWDVHNTLDADTKSGEALNIQLPCRNPTFEG